MVDIRELHPSELPAAAQLLARGMRDDPMHQAVFGTDADHRYDRLHRFFDALLPVMGEVPLSAWDDGRLVGVVGLFPPGTCAPPLSTQLRIVARLFTFNFTELWRLRLWLTASEAHDPRERHWHLGPVAVDVGRQRQGIGGQMLTRFCARMDELGEVAFLETDKMDSVRFYARYGFEVSEQAEVLGMPNWWMRRPAKKRGPGSSS